MLRNAKPSCCHPDRQRKKSKAKKEQEQTSMQIWEDFSGDFGLGIEETRASYPIPGSLTEYAGLVLRGLKGKLQGLELSQFVSISDGVEE